MGPSEVTEKEFNDEVEAADDANTQDFEDTAEAAAPGVRNTELATLCSDSFNSRTSNC